jgi:hypothetical protein
VRQRQQRSPAVSSKMLACLPASRRVVCCSAQLQKDAPATAPRDDMAARALEFFGLLPRQVVWSDRTLPP